MTTVKMPPGAQSFTEEAQTRFLLCLWDIGGADTPIRKSQLMKRLKRSKEKAQQYDPIFNQLEESGAIARTKKGSSFTVSLTEQGLQTLATRLKAPDFQFKGNQVSSKTANALLQWIRTFETAMTTRNVKATIDEIESYEAFREVALSVYDTLNRDYNLDNLVPIYRIRREIRDRVSRSQFNDWMLEMQANDLIQLMGIDSSNVTADQLEDSITPPVGKIRYYTKRL